MQKKKERKTRDAVISVVFARCFCCCRRGTLHAFHFNLISAAFCFHLAPAKGHLASWQLRTRDSQPGTLESLACVACATTWIMHMRLCHRPLPAPAPLPLPLPLAIFRPPRPTATPRGDLQQFPQIRNTWAQRNQHNEESHCRRWRGCTSASTSVMEMLEELQIMECQSGDAFPDREKGKSQLHYPTEE